MADPLEALAMPEEDAGVEDDVRATQCDEIAELLGIDYDKAERLLDILKPQMGLAIEVGEEDV